MKPIPIKNANIQNGLRHLEQISSVKQNKNPFFTSKHFDNISFTGFDFQRTLDKATGNITYTNMDKVAQKLDSALGEQFFSNLLKKAHLSINDKNELVLKDASLIKDILNTIAYPFTKFPLDIANWVLGGLKKFPKLTQKIDRIQAPTTILGRRLHHADVEKSLSTVTDILEGFANPKVMGQKTENGFLFNSDDCIGLFKKNIAAGIKEPAKNYSSRDERTLNRMVTSTVSAVYGGWDFYNISMLQKDDKKEAKKAKNARFKQEMYRMLFNAGTTFLMLGALDKYIKHSLPLSMLTIAGSAFLSEVVSRIFSKTPLKSLTPKEAEKIAKQNNIQIPEDSIVLNNNDGRTTFKQKLQDDTDKIFVQFQSKDGTLPAIKYMKECVGQPDKNKKRKISPAKVITIAFIAASAAYIISAFLKGDFKFKKNIKDFIVKHKAEIDKYINNADTKLDSGILNEIRKIEKDHKNDSKKVNLLKKFRDFATKRTINVDLKELNAELDKVKKTENGQNIKEILQEYKDTITANIKKIQSENKDKNAQDITFTIQAKADRTLLKGVYEGISKLVKTIYVVLSFPGRLIEMGIDNFLYKDSSSALKLINQRNPKVDVEEQLGMLNSIIAKAKDYNTAAAEIAKNTRKFSTGPETSDLANNSRTLVTAISTYFFVNDYRNRVLIESAGKDTQRAKEERNERLAHKGSNFVINGTLMNLFNSIFNKALNNSLPQATLIAGMTEITNEFLVRKSICQPVLPKKSKQAIIDYEEKQMTRKGVFGMWSRLYRKLTGKKSLTQKAGVSNKDKKAG